MPLTGVAAEIEAVIGLEQTKRLLQVYGGTEIEVPKQATGSKLAALIGEVDAGKLIRAIGHGKLLLPIGPFRRDSGRKEHALAMLKAGASLSQVARACDLHMRTVTNYRAELRDDAQLELPFGQSVEQDLTAAPQVVQPARKA